MFLRCFFRDILPHYGVVDDANGINPSEWFAAIVPND